jgi:hypothetical protein
MPTGQEPFASTSFAPAGGACTGTALGEADGTGSRDGALAVAVEVGAAIVDEGAAEGVLATTGGEAAHAASATRDASQSGTDAADGSFISTET